MIDIKELTIDDKGMFDSYMQHKTENSGSSFANIFIWRNTFDTKYAIVDGFLVLFYQSKKGTIHPTMPHGEGDCTKALYEIAEFMDSIDQPFIMETVTEADREKLVCLLGDKVTVCQQRDLFDYVYLAEDLIHLSGKKLHGKRNHINKFQSLYQYEYKPLTPELFDICYQKADTWLLEKYQDKSNSDYQGEMLSLGEAFQHFEALELSGGSIFVDGDLAAFTIGEQLTKDMALVHIEKANTAYQGAYPMINREYVAHQWPHMTYINREEDLGIEGLRKAKLSYQPYKLIKIYNCRLYLEGEQT